MNDHSDLDLLQSYLDGELPEESARALETRLKSEPALADALIRLSREDGILVEWARSMAAAHAEEPISLPLRRRWRGPVVAGVLVACLAVIIFRFLAETETPTLPEIRSAWLDEVNGKVLVKGPDGKELLGQPRQHLSPGDEIQTDPEASAVLAFSDGRRVAMSSSTSLRLVPEETGPKLHLAEGVVHVERGRSDNRPMVLSTPNAMVRFRDARLTSSASGGSTRVDVEQGQAQFIGSTGLPLEIGAGRFVVASPKAERIEPQLLPPIVTEPRSVIPSPRQNEGISALDYGPGGRLLAFGGGKGSVTVWDMMNLSPHLTLPGHARRVRVVDFSPDGQLLASGGDDRAVKVWDTVTGQMLWFSERHKREVDCLAFSGNSRLLATASPLGRKQHGIFLWDARKGELLATLETPGPIMALAFARKGNRLAVAGGKDGMVRLWDVQSQTVTASWKAHDDHILAIAWSPDRKLLATASRDCTVKLWDAETLSLRHVLVGHPREVRDLAFSPNGQWLASAGVDPVVTLWEVKTGLARMRFRGHPRQGVASVRFSPDGKSLATGGNDRLIRIWDVSKIPPLLDPTNRGRTPT